MPELGFIYALVDPQTSEPRYVGKTVDLENRFQGHLKSARQGCLYVHRWIRSLGSSAPVLHVIERVSVEQLNDRERHWIALLRADGARLTNLTSGGDGWPKGQPMPLGRAFHSEESRQRFLDGARRGGLEAARRGSQKGQPKSPETRAKISATLTGRRYGPISEEKRLKLRASARARGFCHKTDCMCRFCENHRPMSARGCDA